MIHSSRFTALLDANVLYPAPLRDFLLRLVEVELYTPKWTNEIQEEWVRNVLLNRPDLIKERLERTVQAMNSAFPDSNIINYEDLITGLSLPDENDRHVLAAAIRGKVDVIITFNLDDFPSDYLKKFDIEPQHPDVFISNIISLDKVKLFQALTNQVNSLKSPPRTEDEVLESLKKCGLSKCIKHLRDINPRFSAADLFM